MRHKVHLQETFDYNPSNSVKIVQDYVNQYKRISAILQENPALLEYAHADFVNALSSSKQGRNGAYTSDQMFRSILVMFLEQWSYRDTVVNIETNEVLRRFVGLGVQPVMDFTFLSKAYGALSETTWEKINEVLNRYACQEGKIGGEKLRVNSTVYETNIHYPTDSSLLWDSFRTLARLLKESKEAMKIAEMPVQGI